MNTWTVEGYLFHNDMYETWDVMNEPYKGQYQGDEGLTRLHKILYPLDGKQVRITVELLDAD